MSSTASLEKTDNGIQHCFTTTRHSYNWERDNSDKDQHPQSVSRPIVVEHGAITEATSADQPMYNKRQVEEVLALTPVTVQTSTESGNGIAPTRVSISR